jgi:uncharacterized protein RhaS with RHS repeats
LLGRFINEDPLGFGGGNDNLYAYVLDDPVNFFDPTGTNALPDPATVAKTARTGWQVIQGGKGAASTTAGELAAELAAAALLYEEARLSAAEYEAIEAYNAESAAYDAELQAIHNLNQVLLTRPLLLVGRYTNRQADYIDYKKRCDQPPPPGLGACGERIWKLQRKIDCRDMRQRWDDTYFPGRHAIDIANLNKGIANDQDWIDKNCK